jgi:DNA-binding transcriptional LysR family regulator
MERPAIVARINSFEAIRGLVETTDYITILPNEIVRRFCGDALAELASDEFRFQTNVVIVHARDLEITVPVQSLIDLVAARLGADR